MLRLRLGFAVKMNHSVNNAKHLAGKTYATLHIVILTVSGTYNNFAKDLGIVQNILPTESILTFIEELLMLIGHALSGSDVGITFQENLLTDLVTHSSVIGIRSLDTNGVASRKVEHNNIIEFHLSQSLQTAILPLRTIQVTLAPAKDCGHRVLGKRHGEWRTRNGRSVTQLAHTEIVAHKHRFL